MLLLAALALGVQASPARAATVTVGLTVQGPAPNPANVNAGDTVVFVNRDGVDHTIKATSGWTFTKVIAAGQQASYVFTKAGTFGYTDQHAVLINEATVVVKGGTPAPSPTARPTTSPKPQPPPKPSATPAATSSATPTQTSTPNPSTGTATRPGIGTAVIPTATPTGLPQPDIAPPVRGNPNLTSSPVPSSAVRYSSRGLVQDSAHRYGLPSALAVVALTGVASLLVRVLLAHPAARRRS